MGISIGQLRGDGEVCQLLAWPFDFDLDARGETIDWFEVLPRADTTVFARDGTGGLFLLYGPQRYLLHITSEGAAGVIARDLTAGLHLVVAHPYWRDLLKFSAGGTLADMRRVAPFLERELREDEPDIETLRSRIRERLGLADGGDPIGDLHEGVSTLGSGISVVAPDGTAFRTLFNTFSVESNPAWRAAEPSAAADRGGT